MHIYGISALHIFDLLKDFAMRSLEIAEYSNRKADVVSQYQVKEGREWDKRYMMTYIYIYNLLCKIKHLHSDHFSSVIFPKYICIRMYVLSLSLSLCCIRMYVCKIQNRIYQHWLWHLTAGSKCTCHNLIHTLVHLCITYCYMYVSNVCVCPQGY